MCMDARTRTHMHLASPYIVQISNISLLMLYCPHPLTLCAVRSVLPKDKGFFTLWHQRAATWVLSL